LLENLSRTGELIGWKKEETVDKVKMENCHFPAVEYCLTGTYRESRGWGEDGKHSFS